MSFISAQRQNRAAVRADEAQMAYAWLGLLTFLVLMVLALKLAHAEEADPFAKLSASKWVTLDNYKPSSEPEEVVAQPEEEIKPVLSRPVDAPVMPGVYVPPAQTQEAQNVWPAFDPDGHKRWYTPDEILAAFDRDQNAKHNGILLDQENLNLRLTYLPNPSIQAIPDVRVSQLQLVEKKAAEGKATAPDKMAARVEKKNAKTTGEKVAAEKKDAQDKPSVEACEALQDMRRRQLEAIESDQRTLDALRQALNDMGLNKRLAFMTGQLSVPEQEMKVEVATPDAQPAPKP